MPDGYISCNGIPHGWTWEEGIRVKALENRVDKLEEIVSNKEVANVGEDKDISTLPTYTGIFDINKKEMKAQDNLRWVHGSLKYTLFYNIETASFAVSDKDGDITGFMINKPELLWEGTSKLGYISRDWEIIEKGE